MIVLLLPLVAAILVFNRFRPFEEQLPETPQVCAFVIQDGPRHTPKCECFETRLVARWDSTQAAWQTSRLPVWLYLLRDTSRLMPACGDTVIARTTIEGNPSARRAFSFQFTIHRSAVTQTVPLQKRLYGRLVGAGLSGDELALVSALTLGYKEDLNPELKRHFQASGAAHILAVSGLHTGIIYAFVIGLLTLGGRFRPMHENRFGRRALGMTVIAFMWGYAWLTGMTPSVVRAVLMVTVFEVGKMAYRQAFSLNTLAAAAVIILLARPTDLRSVSFQLSFTATAAIILFAKEAEKILHRREWLGHWYSRALSWLMGTLIISLAAQLGTLPLSLYYFGQLSTYFLLTNLIVLPLASLLVPCGLLTVMLGATPPGLIIGKITQVLASVMNHAVGAIEALPGSTVQGNVNALMLALYYVLIAFFYFFVLKKDQ